MQATFVLDADKGIEKLKQLVRWFEQEYPPAACGRIRHYPAVTGAGSRYLP